MKTKKSKQVVTIEYWLDGITSSYKVDKNEYYNSYLSGFTGFRLITFDDGTNISINK